MRTPDDLDDLYADDPDRVCPGCHGDSPNGCGRCINTGWINNRSEADWIHRTTTPASHDNF